VDIQYASFSYGADAPDCGLGESVNSFILGL